MARLALFSNGRAGSVKQYDCEGLEQIVLDSGGLVFRPKGWADLHRSARICHEEGVDTAVILGGDGTNHQVKTATLEVYGEQEAPSYVSLGKGTENLERRELGCSDRDPICQIEDVLNGSAEPIEHRQLRITTDKGVHYGFLFGVGLPRAFMEAYYGEGSRRFRTIRKALWSGFWGTGYASKLVAPCEIALTVDGSQITDEDGNCAREYTGIMAAAIPCVDRAHRPFYRAGGPDRDVQVVAVDLSAVQLAWRYWSLRRGKPLKGALVDTTFDRLVLRGDVQYMIDGDIKGAREYRSSQVIVEKGPLIKILKT